MASVVSNRLLGLVLIVALLGAGGRTLWLWLDKPIQRIAIKGELRHIDTAYLNQQILPMVKGQTWLSVDLQELRANTMQAGWIKNARISRRWPNTLVVDIDERRPVAYWNDGQLLGQDGEAFSLKGVTNVGQLPHLGGPPGSGPEVIDYLDYLQKLLTPLSLSVSQLRLEPRGAWRFQANDNFWVMVGQNDREQRLKRFIAAWQRDLESRHQSIRYIDLRYPNGIAVSWHGESAAAD